VEPLSLATHVVWPGECCAASLSGRASASGGEHGISAVPTSANHLEGALYFSVVSSLSCASVQIWKMFSRQNLQTICVSFSARTLLENAFSTIAGTWEHVHTGYLIVLKDVSDNSPEQGYLSSWLLSCPKSSAFARVPYPSQGRDGISLYCLNGRRGSTASVLLPGVVRPVRVPASRLIAMEGGYRRHETDRLHNPGPAGQCPLLCLVQRCRSTLRPESVPYVLCSFRVRGRSLRCCRTLITTIPGRECSAAFRRRAVWLCKKDSHQWATTNSGRMTVSVSSG